MIARVWRAKIDAARADEYEAFARERSALVFAAQRGHRGTLMYRRGADCTVTTFWDSEEDADRMAQAADYVALVAAIRATGFILEDAFDGYFGVHLASENFALDA
jgi:heme-degrading monooxygenase HmoA